MISILIPHKSTPLNDKALELNLRMLRQNTKHAYELIVVENYGDPYLFWNDYSEHAKYEPMVFSSSDMLMAPEWDTAMLGGLHGNAIVTGYLVEPGVIGVSPKNICLDLGRSPETFQRGKFEEVSKTSLAPMSRMGLGWYMPFMITKTLFKRLGKYPYINPFPYHNDVHFFEKAEKEGVNFVQAKSFAFHFQNLSNSEHDARR